MTAGRDPMRSKALAYISGHRIGSIHAAGGDPDLPAAHVRAWIRAAPSDRSRNALVRRTPDGVWSCTVHPDEERCAHRMAVQIVTGHLVASE